MSGFSWDEVYQRRVALAAEVSKGLGLSFGLTAGVRESFDLLELNEQGLADVPMWRVPFLVIAHYMDCSVRRRIIDHAWWLIADDRNREPWGFVTEPYIEPEIATKIASGLSHKVQSWGVKVEALTAEKSPWNPGSTVPIVTTVGAGCLHEFLALGVKAALDWMVIEQCEWVCEPLLPIDPTQLPPRTLAQRLRLANRWHNDPTPAELIRELGFMGLKLSWADGRELTPEQIADGVQDGE